MPSDLRISSRERLVLTSIIESYIATGQPVGSGAVARQLGNKEGMSAATIRNLMASLDEAGLLDQPHTSAGRIPTPQAFRFYVEQLASPARLGPLAPERIEQIHDTFAGVNTSQQFLERTSHMLALISSGVGVAISTAAETQTLEHIHFSRLGAGRVLAVVVTMEGTVQDRVLSLDRDLSLAELEFSARYLNENFHGWGVDRIQLELARRLEAERSEYDRLMHSLEELYRKGALESEASAAVSIFIEGTANLLASEIDRGRLQTMLHALEAKERLISLLNAYVDARQQNVRVVVGLEETLPGLHNVVLIGAPARIGAENIGTLAVIAPTRIQYEQTIGAVSYLAQLSDRLFPSSQ
ncbi:heat-inducible transcriptional repressor HrcA [Silvibacterium dinghuense]|uniref:Heat-inducible transcription repressor HrcA n=1 Tax=Silvibacterium dinghuense TaxID=1560006 RepID=A0A4Q1SIL8_9BACT|nr:heat-inducible transcriptional repressor HrcA [Silvibacterium dinghuense]RXS97239.1 heat-inducible transcription repressor HrcA [Silvibacterium dinghuense]GGG97365.1 heat-inducible transcription repressor HrcA [Silvibacterium dinghuense]